MLCVDTSFIINITLPNGTTKVMNASNTISQLLKAISEAVPGIPINKCQLTQREFKKLTFIDLDCASPEVQYEGESFKKTPLMKPVVLPKGAGVSVSYYRDRIIPTGDPNAHLADLVKSATGSVTLSFGCIVTKKGERKDID